MKFLNVSQVPIFIRTIIEIRKTEFGLENFQNTFR